MAENPGSINIEKKKFKPLRSLAMLVLLGLAVHLILPQITSLEHSFSVIKNMKWWSVALAVIAQVLSYAGTGFLLSATAKAGGGDMKILTAAGIAMAGANFGMLAGGMVGTAAVTYRWMQSRGVPKEGALLSGTLPSLLNNALLLLVSIFGLFHLLITHDLSTLQMVIFGISSALLLGVAVVLIYSMKHRSWLVGWVAKIRVFWAKLRHKEYEVDAGQVSLKQLYDAWDSLQKIGWRQPVLGSIMNIGFDLLTLFFLFVAAGHAVSPGILLAGYGLPLLLGKMTFLPGGVGIVESTMATLYNGLGVPSGVTVVVILAYRAVSFWLPTLIGFPLIPYFQHGS